MKGVALGRLRRCALLLLAFCAPARGAEPAPWAAQPTPNTTARVEVCGGAGPEILEVVLSLPTAASDAALRRAVCDWFREERWRVRFSSRPTSPERPSAVLRVSLVVTPTGAVQLIADGPRGPWTHDVPLAAGLDAAGIEAVAEAMHSAAQAETALPIVPRGGRAAERRLDQRQAQGLAAPSEADDVPPLEPAPVTSTGERVSAPRPRVDGVSLPVHTALGYQAYARGPEPFVHGPALHIELDAFSRGVTLGASFRASLFMAASNRISGFEVRTSGASLSLGASVSAPVAGLTARAGLGAGVDLVALAVRVTDPELVRRRPADDSAPRPFVSAEAGVRHRVGSFEFGVDAGLRLLWQDSPYQLVTPDGAVTVLDPWRLQPGALIELGYVW